MDRAARQSLRTATRAGDQPSQPITRATLRRIAHYGRRHGWSLICFMLASVVHAAFAVATPILAGRVVDAIVRSADQGLIVRLAVLIAVIALVDAGVELLARWLSSRIGEGLIYDLRTELYAHVQRQPIAFFMRTRTGALVSRLNNDVVGAQRAFATTLSGVVSNLVMLVLALGAMVTISWQITLLTLLMLPVFMLPARRMGGLYADLLHRVADVNARMGTQMTERFSTGGATLVKLYGRPDAEAATFAGHAGEVRDIGVKTAMAQFTFVTALTLVSALALALVYGLGGYYSVDGRLEAGEVVALALLLTRLYAPLTALATARVDIMSAIVAFERVFEVLDLQPMITEPEHPAALPDGPLGVEFRQVRFSYPTAGEVSLASLEAGTELVDRGGIEILHDVSFTVRPGSMVALVGSSGAGKSTIAQLIPRLYDVTSGQVLIGGEDVRQLAFAELRGAIGYVMQDGHMFHDTLRSNLTLGQPDAPDDALWDVLRRVRLDELIRSLPDGLSTIVGERGYRFSGGERQRLTIARILLAQPRLIILDEATASLDSTSEALVQEALSEALAGRTAVVIAHRLSTIRQADEILVIEGGQVVERGTHRELLAQSGRYAELYHTQFREEATSTAR